MAADTRRISYTSVSRRISHAENENRCSNIEEENDLNASALHQAASEGKFHRLLLLINVGHDINARTNDGKTALYLSSQNGHVKCVETLLSFKANTLIPDEKRCTPLHIACLHGQHEIVKILLKHGANINVSESNGLTPLHIAAFQGHNNIVQILVSTGASETVTDCDGWTPLHCACEGGQDEVVRFLFDPKNQTNFLTHEGYSPLHLACKSGHDNVVNSLISLGCDVNRTDGQSCTPLHLACEEGYKEIVEILLRSKANVNATESEGWTPLHFACQQGYDDIVDLLITSKADVNAVEKRLWTPLHIACLQDSVTTVDVLIRAGALINAVNMLSETPLRIAADNGHDNIVKRLIAVGAESDVLLNEAAILSLTNPGGTNDTLELLSDVDPINRESNDDDFFSLANDEFEVVNLSHSIVNEKYTSPVPGVVYRKHDEVVDIPNQIGESVNSYNDFETSSVNEKVNLSSEYHNIAAVSREKCPSPPLAVVLRRHQEIVDILPQTDERINGYDFKISSTASGVYDEANLPSMYRSTTASGKSTSSLPPIPSRKHNEVVNIPPQVNQTINGYHIASDIYEEINSSGVYDNIIDIDTEVFNSSLPATLHKKQNEFVDISLEIGATVSGYDPSEHFSTASGIYDEVNLASVRAKTSVNASGICTPPPLPPLPERRENLVDKPLQNSEKINGYKIPVTIALHKACEEGREEVVKKLLERNVDVNVSDINGDTPLILASKHGHVRIVQVLASSKADFKVKNKKGHTALFEACCGGHKDVVNFLLQQGAEIETGLSNGWRPIHIATSKGHKDVVEILTQQGADILARTKGNATPLDLARHYGHRDIVEFLYVKQKQIRRKKCTFCMFI